uniref:CSON013120 protein n=1 Tax=Culicoides sonorensis TaxID=179676 RepID=A0A336M723_CULSO
MFNVVFLVYLSITLTIFVFTLQTITTTNAQGFCTDNENIHCSSVTQTDNNGINLTWPVTQSGNIAFSRPFCLDDKKNSIIRTCCNGLWGQVTDGKCSFYAYEFNKKCPKNYTEIYINRDKILCVMIGKQIEWTANCLDSGTQFSYLDLIGEEKERVNAFLREKQMTEMWLPAKRFGPFEPVVWKLPGWMWNKPIEFEDYPINFTSAITNFNYECLKLVINSNEIFEIEFDDCRKNLPSLCVFDETKAIIDTGNCISTRYKGDAQKKCYAVSSIPDNITILESNLTIKSSEVFVANSVEKLIIYEQIVRKKHHFDVNNRKCLAHFTNDSQLYGANGKWSVLQGTGKWAFSPHFNCIATEVSRSDQTPNIILKYNPAQTRLSLVVYSGENLWREDNKTAGVKCFTNADYELVKVIKVKRKLWSGVYRFPIGNTIKEVTKDIYDVKLYGDGPGYYWCEGHSIPDFKLIQTGKIYASRKMKGVTYAVALKVNLGVPLDIEKDKKLLKNLAREYKDHIRLVHDTSSKNLRTLAHRITSVRPMKIEDYDATTMVAKFIFHITITTNLTEIGVIESTLEPQISIESLQSPNGVYEGLPLHIKEYYEIKSQLNTVLLQANSVKFTYITMNSTEYCLPTLKTPEYKFHWIGAHIGQQILSSELCLRPDGLPLSRKCEGDLVYGGAWSPIDLSQVECVSESDLPEITKTLYEIDKGPITIEQAHGTMGAMSEMTENVTQVIPSDVYFLSKTIQMMTKLQSNKTSVDNAAYYNNLVHILNNLMAVNETIVEKSASNLNATNMLLDSFDTIINQFAETLANNEVLLDNKVNQENDGTILVITPKLIVFITEPSTSGISGIALIRKNLTNFEINNFTEYEIVKIQPNQSVDNLLAIQGLELATFAPQDLINRLDEVEIAMNLTGPLVDEPDPLLKIPDSNPVKKEPLRVIVTIYFNDHLFVETSSNQSKSASKVVSVTLPGHGTDLPVLFPTIFRLESPANDVQENDLSGNCGYWDYGSYQMDHGGKWSSEGCEYLGKSSQDDKLIACGCTHLTHFAYLVMGTLYHTYDDSEEHRIIEEKHAEALDIITFIGCSLSLLGILGIAITAVAFKSWREKIGTKVLLHLSAAIALEMILIAYINTESLSKKLVLDNSTWNCIFLGATMHYSILVVFSWMLITAFLQFMRYVKVLGETRPPRFLLKSSLIGWVIPLIPVLIIIGVSPLSYLPPSEPLVPGICYPKGNALYFGLLLPISLIIIANLVVFIIVIYNIFKIPELHIRTNERELLVSQLRLSINLFFLLGLSWIFGLATISKAGIIFSYLFCLTATLQGFVLFIYFILMDPMTRRFWQIFLSNMGFSCVEKPKEFE